MVARVPAVTPAPHAYKAPSTYRVILVVTHAEPPWKPQAHSTLRLDRTQHPPPRSSFSGSPLAGEPVLFAGGSDPDVDDSVTRLWDFGDGATDTGPTPSHTYANAGDYTATLTATDEHGASGTTFQTVTVRAPTEAPPAEGPPASAPVAGLKPLNDPFTPLVRMRPFPVVRIAGVVLPRGARVQFLSVRAPRGSRIQVRCLGRGCPVGSMATTSAKRLVRLRKFERRLAAGTRLRLFVRQKKRIGKYTSFLIRAGAPPKRADLCLFPTSRSPGAAHDARVDGSAGGACLRGGIPGGQCCARRRGGADSEHRVRPRPVEFRGGPAHPGEGSGGRTRAGSPGGPPRAAPGGCEARRGAGRAPAAPAPAETPTTPCRSPSRHPRPPPVPCPAANPASPAPAPTPPAETFDDSG